MSVMVLLEINVPAGKSGAVETMLAEMLVDTRKFDGCLGVDAIRNQENPGNFFLIERWQSRAHHERYNAWRAETGASSSAAEELQAEYNIRWFDELAV
jgi:quinol monooxygenase YgiN